MDNVNDAGINTNANTNTNIAFSHINLNSAGISTVDKLEEKNPFNSKISKTFFNIYFLAIIMPASTPTTAATATDFQQFSETYPSTISNPSDTFSPASAVIILI